MTVKTLFDRQNGLAARLSFSTAISGGNGFYLPLLGRYALRQHFRTFAERKHTADGNFVKSFTSCSAARGVPLLPAVNVLRICAPLSSAAQGAYPVNLSSPAGFIPFLFIFYIQCVINMHISNFFVYTHGGCNVGR